ncbi:MAG: WbqC family protein [Cyclobacteriaceae bacterium]|nr:WbqC family protein [Cyclobacteriaceae bacterium]
MSGLLIESHFLPSLEYFCLLSRYEDIRLEAHEYYVKQSYRNRCYLLSAHGAERHTIPLTGKHGKVPIHEVRIDYSVRWQANFWRSVQSAYANSPFFEHYRDDLHDALFASKPYLLGLNLDMLSLCLKWLGWKKSVSLSASYEVKTDRDDFRNLISDKRDFRNRTILRANPYPQVFGNPFVPNLSILDLVCCVGPDAGRYISGSAAAGANENY